MNPQTVLFLMTAIQIATSFAATSVPAISPLLAAELGVPASWTGFYTALLYGGAAISAVYFGTHVQRIGSWRVSRISLFICAFALVLISTCQIGLIAIGAVLLGLGYGGITPASSHLLTMSTVPARRSLVFSIKQSGVPAGAALAAFILPLISKYLSVSGTFMVSAGFCAIAGFFTLRFGGDITPESRERASQAMNRRGPVALLTTVAPLRILAAVAFVYGGLQVTVIAMLVPFLREQCGMTVAEAASMLAVASCSGLIFRLVWGHVVDRGVSAMRLLSSLGFLAAFGFLILVFSGKETTSMLVALAACGLGASVIAWNGVALAEATKIVEPKDVGTATGVCLFASFIGVLVVPTTFAMMLSASISFRVSFLIASCIAIAVAVLAHVGAPKQVVVLDKPQA